MGVMARHGYGIMADAPFQKKVIIRSYIFRCLPYTSLHLQAIETILEQYSDETVEAGPRLATCCYCSLLSRYLVTTTKGPRSFAGLALALVSGMDLQLLL